MCGIAGIFKLSDQVRIDDINAVLQMMDAQIHRGPDDWGMLLPDTSLSDPEVKGLLADLDPQHIMTYPNPVNAPVAILGSRRLSILDLTANGRMPMGNQGRTAWITYNGEVYNWRELRAELEGSGCYFTSNTDTEVILRAYETWGDSFLKRLRGMLAVAIFDISSTSPRLILAKDRFGMKPLYYHFGPERLIFASEVRSIMKSGLIPNKSNLEAYVGFLTLGSVPIPLTTIENVRAVPASSMLLVDKNGSSAETYWNISNYLTESTSPIPAVSEQFAISTIRELLDESVNLHLVSDVPLGVFLSGGIDSSALVAIASRYKQPLTTVSVAFGEAEYSEAKYSWMLANKYRTNHIKLMVDRGDVFDELPNVLLAMDQPTIDGLNTYFISRAAKRAGLTVVLSGAGGDEVFLGYGHFKKIRSLERTLRLFATAPRGIRSGVAQLGVWIGTAAGRRSLTRLTYLADPNLGNLYLMFRGLFAPREVQELLDITEKEFESLSPVPKLLDDQYPRNYLRSFNLLEFRHYLQNQLLKDTDFMSMAHSVEVRLPYLDHRLAEYVMSLPDETKLDNEINKKLLVKALGERLPREVWDRAKMGFTFPFSVWLSDKMVEFETETILKGLLDADSVRRVWKGFKEGKVHWSRPWALAVLGLGQSGVSNRR